MLNIKLISNHILLWLVVSFFLYLSIILIPNKSYANIDVLPVDEVFNINVEILDKKNIIIKAGVLSGYYLYKDKFQFIVEDKKINAIFPESKIIEDEFFGKSHIFDSSISIPLGVNTLRGDEPILTVKYQGCANIGLCYPPQIRKFQLISFNNNLDTQYKPQLITQKNNKTISNNLINSNDSFEKKQISLLSKNSNLLWVIFIFVIIGILLTFTPCTLPMLPILSSIILGKNYNYKKSFVLSSIFVLSMSFTYALLGVLFSFLGYNIQILLQQEWLLIIYSLLFLILALSMFGLYEIKIPSSVYNKLTKLNNKQKSGSFIGAFIMGIASALITGPCLTPALAAALVYVSDKELLLGFFALFSLGLGMGIPLILIATGLDKILPKSNKWLNNINTLGGFLLLGLIIYFLERGVISEEISLYLWSALFISFAITILVINRFNFKKIYLAIVNLLAIIIFIYGLSVSYATINGNDNLYTWELFLQDKNDQKINNKNLKFITKNSLEDLNNKIAANKNKIIMINFDAKWCVICRINKKTIFANIEVQKQLADVILLKVDMTDVDDNILKITKKFNVIAPPVYIFFKGGKLIRDFTMIGQLNKKDFLKVVSNIKSL